MGRISIQPTFVVLLSILSPCREAAAQRITPSENVGPLAARLDPQAGDTSLPCEVVPLRPTLNYGFRFQAGYSFRVPLSLYQGGRHRWVALTRITPEEAGSRPSYLVSYGRFPSPSHATKAKGEAAGAFWLGEGRYTVKWMLQDDRGRVCRKEWRMEAGLSWSDRKIKLTIPRSTVAELSWRGFSDPAHVDDAAPMHLTVLLDAAPRRVRRTSQSNLNAGDQLQLLGALSELVHDIPAASVRLVVFSLEQQKEVLRRDDFHVQEIDQVADALNGLSLGTVDSSVLRDPGGRVRLVADLLKRELNEAPRSDKIVILGPENRFNDKFPTEALDRSGQYPRFYYLQCMPAPRIVSTQGFDLSQSGVSEQLPAFVPQGSPGSPSDLIRSAMKRVAGETISVYTPGQFAKAVERIQRDSLTLAQ